MQQPVEPYKIVLDADAKALRLTFNGFWDTEILTSFQKDVEAATKKIRQRNRDFHTLIDQRLFGVQSAETASGLTDVFDANYKRQGGRVAIVIGGTLSKLQIERHISTSRLKTFRNISDACAWLEITC